MSKPRILLVNEASFLSTGFSVYGMEVMKRLYNKNKYELAEFASYGHPGDPRQNEFPWRYYGNGPDKDPEQQRVFNSKPTNQFGEWRFEEVLLDFQPDIVFDIRDWWMIEFQERSAFRNCFRWVVMPTVDGAPQEEPWISTFTNADKVLTYSDWGKDVLDIQGGGKINTVSSAPPCADLDVFKPVPDKKAHKKNLGLPEDSFIIGTVMRNQKRKLYPDLIQAFEKFINECNKSGLKELANKSYLYIHTSYPDIGWDIPRLVKESNVGHKIIFTYMCRQCKASFTSFFQDARGLCPQCNVPLAGLPNTNMGVTRPVLANIINTFDVYVQYSICEGFGMPQVEAAACGVPVMAVDYSAMSDVVRKVKGMPIKVQRYYRESETHCMRALPDNDDFVRQLKKFLTLPESEHKRKAQQARESVEKHYTWDKTASVWEKTFDSLELKDRKSTWGAKPKVYQPPASLPQNANNEQLVRWGINHILNMPELADSYLAMRLIRDLNYGATVDAYGGFALNENSTIGSKTRFRNFTQEDAIRELYEIRQLFNQWEMRRAETKVIL